MGQSSDEKTEVLAGGDPRLQPRLGRYRLERRIGAGGMAEIFLARMEGPGGFEKQVVVKRIRPQLAANPRFIEMFLREARVLSRLDHPNIVRIIELDEQNGEYFLALEYLDGLSLRELAERHWAAGRPLPIESLVQIIADAALGLDHAHSFPVRDEELARAEPGSAPTSLVHRDVSPDNLFVTTTGLVKVLDFGIAKLEGIDNLTQAGELKGKVPFMSPEHLMGRPLDARADLFSVGVVLYWLLAGRRPFDGTNDVHTMKAIIEDPPPALRGKNPRVPVLLEDLVMSLLEKDRDRRIKSASALHDALLTLLVGLPRSVDQRAALVAAAQRLPSMAHEVVPVGVAAVPTAPWPDGSRGGRQDIASAPTRARALVVSPPPNDAAATQKIKMPPQGFSSEESHEGATEVVSQKDLLPTDEHERVAAGAADSTATSTEAASSTHPSMSSVSASSRLSPPHSSPLIDVERIAADAISPSPSPSSLGSLASLGRGARTERGGRATLEMAPLRRDTEEEPAGDRSADGSLAPLGLEPPSRLTPVFAGMTTAAVVVLLGLWLTGAGSKLASLFGAEPSASGSAAVADGGVGVVGALATLVGAVDAGVLLAPASDDAGATSADADDGAAAPVVPGADAAPVPAGEPPEPEPPEPPEPPDERGDGSVDEEDFDAGEETPEERRGPRRRPVRVVGPRWVQWQGPAGEVYGVGRGTLRLPESVRTIVAYDTRRGGRTRIALERGTARVDYARLPLQELDIRVRPYAEVWLGKERLGLTPLAPLRVVAGAYEVRFVYKKVVKVIPVEVKPNKPAVMNVVMAR